MKISREVKTAILAIVAIAIVIFGYSFMAGQDLFNSNRSFYVVYDNVDGLSGNAGVTINGMKVGEVSGVRFLDSSGKILVTLEVKNDFKFSKNSLAEIYSDGLIGGKSLKIVPGKGPLAHSGDTLVGRVEAGMLGGLTHKLDPIQKKVESALTKIDSLVASFNDVLDAEGRDTLKHSLADFRETMNHLNHSSAQIDQVLQKNTVRLDTTIGNFSQTAYNVRSISDSLAQIKVRPLVDKLKETIANFNEISTKMNNGEGTMGKLINDDTMYNNLERTTKQMEELVQDIKLNPRRYINLKFSIFGGKNKTKPYKKPGDSLK